MKRFLLTFCCLLLDVPGFEIAELTSCEIESSGQTTPGFLLALQTTGEIQQKRKWKLSSAERTKLLVESRTKGSAFKGEMIYRRKKLMCQKCHSIAGYGGKVGPDFVDLGTSAQPDYILESILDPRTKVKEKYHSVVVITNKGKAISGIRLRKTDHELILRNADDEIVSVPLASIEAESDGGSLMPSGLLDSLTRNELVHLLRFLTDLGKVRRYSTPKENFIRSWHVPVASTDLSPTEIAESPATIEWETALSRVNGTLPISELPVLESDGQEFVAVRFTIEDLAEGSRLRIYAGSSPQIWIDGKASKAGDANEIRTTGSKEFVIAMGHPTDVPSIKIQILKR